jgi:hypothetical protein
MFREKQNRRKKQPAKNSRWLLVGVGLVIAVMIALPFLFLKHHFALTQHPDWNPTEVQVLGTRVVTAYATDAGESHPATFYYRAEAEVQYLANGQKFDVWLPASKATSDRLDLEMWLSDKKARFATVLWNPKRPGEGEGKLKSDIGSHFSEFD